MKHLGIVVGFIGFFMLSYVVASWFYDTLGIAGLVGWSFGYFIVSSLVALLWIERKRY